MTEHRPLTPKEQKVVDEFESARPGLDALKAFRLTPLFTGGLADE